VYHAWQTSAGGGFTDWVEFGEDPNVRMRAVATNGAGDIEVFGHDGTMVTHATECPGAPAGGRSGAP